MKYKALICDVDGTLIENKRDAHPSPSVKNAIKQIQQTIHVGIATARPYIFVEDLIDELHLQSPCILANGAQIYDPGEKKYLIQHSLPLDTLERIFSTIRKLDVSCTVQEMKKRIIFTEDYHPEEPLYIYVPPFADRYTEAFVEGITSIPTLTLHKMEAWEKGKLDYLITHQHATKQHAIVELARILGIETHEIIGIGDGYNDFPLLMACGLKIAMGNAVDELKAIADFIAPSVEEDGVATVIEKFLLQ